MAERVTYTPKQSTNEFCWVEVKSRYSSRTGCYTVVIDNVFVEKVLVRGRESIEIYHRGGKNLLVTTRNNLVCIEIEEKRK